MIEPPAPAHGADAVAARVAPGDAIVVVGASCRFPGSASLDAYWRNLLEGRSCVSKVTRWSLPSPVHGGLLDDIAGFDADFFRISPKEARCMDPQHRLLLEVAHHAIEDCGAGLPALRDLRCGVFCTSLPGDYKFLLAADREQAFSSQSFLGNAASSLSGRVSYFYDFKGPSLTLDTACSSSLTALQIACLQLRAGECGAALVAAAAVFSTAEIFEFGQRAGMLSARGQCATFSEQADGFVPAEGAAALVVTTRSQAERLGLEIHATIEAIALNHDGQSNGLMAPNAQAQRELIADLYRRNDIDVAQIGYVETHGTGTRLGDPIEMRGLVGAFDAAGRPYDAWIGASKAVIGHTLVCSGLASVIKAMLVLRHRMVPPHPVDGAANPDVSFGGFRVNRQAEPWPSEKRYAAVSAFGFTGSNGHVLLGLVDSQPRVRASRSLGPFPFLFSAQSPHSLERLLHAHSDAIERGDNVDLEALSAMLVSRTMPLRCRAAIVASSRTELLAGLRRLRAAGPAQDDRLQACGDAPAGLVASVGRWLYGDNGAFPAEGGQLPFPKVGLPRYPFEHRDYWIGPPPEAGVASIGTATPGFAPILDLLTQRLAESLGFTIDQIDPRRPVRDFGADSLTIIQMLAQLGPVAARMQPHDIFDYPSLEALAQDIAAGDGAPAPALAAPARTRPVASRSLLQWRDLGGDGDRPVLLLPPLNMGDDAWYRQSAYLRRLGFSPRVAIYPGHLDNPFGPEAGAGASVDREAIVDALATAIRERHGSAPLIGWSLGGCFSLDLAIRAPQLVSSMILVSTAANFGDDVFGRTLDLNAELVANAELLDLCLGGGDRVVERLSAGASVDILARYYRMLGEFDVTAQLPDVSTRTLVVHGCKDAVISNADIGRLRRLSRVEVVEMREHGHFIPLLAAPRFNQVIEDFLLHGFVSAA